MIVTLHLIIRKQEIMSIGKFEIREYGRTELAQMYSPDISPESAWKKLKGWMAYHPRLPMVLASLGYRADRQRSFTPAQVKAIAEALGEP